MSDLFEREQRILDRAAKHVIEIQSGSPCNSNEYITIVKEYGRILKHLRRVTRISDKTTDALNTSKLDLLDKVHYDVLTGIYNRRFMEENLKRIIKSIARAEGLLSLLMVDVDYFKKYNDTYGHSKGDECLRIIANSLAGSITRANDFVARYGGEEFVVVLPYTDEVGAKLLAERMLKNIESLNIPHEESSVASCATVSIGATTGLVKHTQSGEDYIKRADEALYMSKRNGRNRYTFVSLEEGKK